MAYNDRDYPVIPAQRLDADDLALLDGGGSIPAVATFDDLPTAPSGNPVYLVLAVGTPARPVLYAWQGTQFVAVGGAVSGSGGSAGGVAVRNLFVGPTRPDVSDIFLDSLWIKTTGDGAPAPMAEWEVYTGTGDGDGGNLILSMDQPTPLVDALWVPLNADGTPRPHTEWVVFTGHGTQPGVGNDNLYIQAAVPTTPVVGSLHIPLNTSGAARSMDLWRINV